MVALCLLVAVSLTSVVDASVIASAPSMIPLSPESFLQKFDQMINQDLEQPKQSLLENLGFEIPTNLMSVESSEWKNSKDTIFLISEAHSSQTIQKQIHDFLKVLEEKSAQVQDAAPLRLYVEGAWGRVFPTIFKHFPFPAVLSAWNDRLMSWGVYSGWEAWLQDADTRGRVYGLENKDSYHKHRVAFKAWVKARNEVDRWIPLLTSKREQILSEYFKGDMQSLLSKENLFFASDASPEALIKQLLKTEILWQSKEYLPMVKEHRSSTKMHAFEIRKKYPHLAEMLKLYSMDAENQDTELGSKIKALNDAQRQSLYAGNLETQDTILLHYQSMIRDLKEQPYSQLYQEMKSLMREIKQRRLDAQELVWVEQLETLDLIMRGLKLELFESEIDQAKQFTDQQLPSWDLSASERQNLLELWSLVNQFYHWAKVRDEALAKHLSESMTRNQVLDRGSKQRFHIVITGGFHRDYIAEQLRGYSANTIILQPRGGKSSKDAKEIYQKSILDLQGLLKDKMKRNGALNKIKLNDVRKSDRASSSNTLAKATALKDLSLFPLLQDIFQGELNRLVTDATDLHDAEERWSSAVQHAFPSIASQFLFAGSLGALMDDSDQETLQELIEDLMKGKTNKTKDYDQKSYLSDITTLLADPKLG